MSHKSGKSGIYAITNKVNNKIYIGYAKDVSGRLSWHQRFLVKNKHTNGHLQNAVNEYGIDNFLFEQIEWCDHEFLCLREHYWATILKVHNREFGYNIAPTDPDGANKTVSEETKDKFRGGKRYEISKVILQFSKEGVFIKEWLSIADALREFKNNTIRQCLYGKCIYACNSIWLYKEDFLNGKLPISKNDNQKRKIDYFDSNNIYIRSFESIVDAANILNINKSSIKKSLREEVSVLKNKYLFKYKENG